VKYLIKQLNKGESKSSESTKQANQEFSSVKPFNEQNEEKVIIIERVNEPINE
jgi:hypothetical protein